jgi:hypothetical protein
VRDLYAKLGRLSGGFEQKLVMKVLGSEIINVSGKVIEWAKTNVKLSKRDRNSKSESLNQKTVLNSNLMKKQKSEQGSSLKSESKTDSKSGSKSESKSDSKSDPKSDSKSDSKSNSKSDSNTTPKPESITFPKIDSTSNSASDPKPLKNPDLLNLNMDSLPSLNKFDELIQKIQTVGTTELDSDWECSTNFESYENEGIKKESVMNFDDESSISDSLSGNNDMRQKVCSSSDEELRAGRHYEDELDAECEMLECERLEYDEVQNGTENGQNVMNNGSKESCGYPRGSSDEDVTETGNCIKSGENAGLDATMSNEPDSKNSIVSDVTVGNRFTHLLGGVGTD